MRFILGIALVASVAAAARAQTPGSAAVPFPPDDSLHALAVRGRLLATYDYVAWHGSDAAAPLAQPGDTIDVFVALRDDTSWVLSLGVLSPDSAVFLTRLRATLHGDSGQFVAVRYATPERNGGRLAAAARAFAKARASMGKTSRPYNAAVLPAGDGGFDVFEYPAPLQEGEWPVGADVRFHMSPDGRTILARTQLHNTIIEFWERQATDSTGARVKATFATAVLSQTPVETDFLHVMQREPAVPEYVVSDAFVFEIFPNGVLRYIGRREDVLKP